MYAGDTRAVTYIDLQHNVYDIPVCVHVRCNKCRLRMQHNDSAVYRVHIISTYTRLVVIVVDLHTHGCIHTTHGVNRQLSNVSFTRSNKFITIINAYVVCYVDLLVRTSCFTKKYTRSVTLYTHIYQLNTYNIQNGTICKRGVPYHCNGQLAFFLFVTCSMSMYTQERFPIQFINAYRMECYH